MAHSLLVYAFSLTDDADAADSFHSIFGASVELVLKSLFLEPLFDFGINHVTLCAVERLEAAPITVPFHQGHRNLFCSKPEGKHREKR